MKKSDLLQAFGLKWCSMNIAKISCTYFNCIDLEEKEHCMKLSILVVLDLNNKLQHFLHELRSKHPVIDCIGYFTSLTDDNHGIN